MFCILVLLSYVVFASSGRSPHADYVEELFKTDAFGTRISNNIIEDATLDLPDLVRKYNYPFEEHFAITEDGYILGLHRIPHGRDLHNIPGDRPSVLIMHGLPTSSSDHVIMGPGTAIAYILAEEGYDVWMGNARGNYFSRRHINLDPDDPKSDFWNYSWDEIGEKDLPAMIDYILHYTGRSGLHYIGFSQGTTILFVMGSLRPEYNEKIISVQAMAPVAYMEHSRNPLFSALAPHERELVAFLTNLGIREIFPNHDIFGILGKIFCKDGVIFQPLCSGIIFSIAGWNENQHNATMLPVIFAHAPAGISIRQLAHYGQSISGKDFRRYDFGPVENLLKYGSLVPPKYDLSKVTAPIFLHYSAGDPLADILDVHRLYNELGRPMGKYIVSQETFSHVDFMWGIDAKTFVYDRAISFMRLMDVIN